MSEVEQTPGTEPEDKIVEQSETTDESTADSQEVETEEQSQEPEAKPEKTFTQAELDQIVQKRLAKESRRVQRQAEIEAENRYLKQQLEANKPQEQQLNERPTVDEFETYEDYMDALSDWKVEQKLAGFQQQTQQQQQEAQQRQQAQEAAARAQQKMSEASAKYSDFQDVVGDPNLNITPVMSEVMLESENFADIAYHLGNHPEEADRIAKLSPAAQAREIIKLESKVNEPPATTKAPPPIEPSGQKAKSKKAPADMTPSEWAEWVRNARKQIR